MCDPTATPTPCRGTCRLGPDGLCDGCGRTLDEIAAWVGLSLDARRGVMERVRDWAPRENRAGR